MIQPDPPVLFDSDRIEREWNDASLRPLLREIVLDGAAYAHAAHGWTFVVDSIYRTPEENTAAQAKTLIHCYWRAVDVRGRGHSQVVLDELAKYVNDRWVYNAHPAPGEGQHPVCYTAPHGSGPHAHFQIHFNTARRVNA